MQMPRCSACKNISRAFKPKTTRADFYVFFYFFFAPFASTKPRRNGKHFQGGSPKASNFPELSAAMQRGRRGAGQAGVQLGSLNRAPSYPLPPSSCCSAGAAAPGAPARRGGWARGRAPHGRLGPGLQSTGAWGGGVGFYLFALLFIFPAKVLSSMPAPSQDRRLLQRIKAQPVPPSEPRGDPNSSSQPDYLLLFRDDCKQKGDVSLFPGCFFPSPLHPSEPFPVVPRLPPGRRG